MIVALYQHLTQHMETVPAWKQFGTDLTNADPPYGVMELRSDQRSVDNAQGGWEYVRLWVYFPRGSWLPVEAAIRELKYVFKGVALTDPDTGGRFVMEPLTAGPNIRDPDLNLFGRYVDFRSPTVAMG